MTPTSLIVHRDQPLNAEPPLARLRRSFLTPADDFYIRTHGTIPALDPAAHVITVDAGSDTPLALTLGDIKARFPERSVTATLQCAGNRRADMQQVGPVSGDPWAAGAIGCAEWTGAALADILRAAGVSPARAAHVAFEAADESEDGGGTTYGASIPLRKALQPEVLVAHSLNGRPLRPEHGAPLRLVVPGYAGVRSVKWVTAIRVQPAPSSKIYQQQDYKLFPAHVTADNVDYSRGMIIYEMPVNSAICEPAAWQMLAAGRTSLRGYATAGERRVARVEVSIDGGRHWAEAAFAPADAEPWAWVFWELAVDIPAGTHELVVRAWDSAGQTQPALPDDTWNFKGYLCASWHRVWVRAQ